MRGRIILITSVILLTLFLSSCARTQASDVVSSTKLRDFSPVPNSVDVEKLATDNTLFALNMYRSLKTSPGNLFFSPHSITLALAMTYAGAQGETERQMAKALNYNMPQDQLHRAFNALDLELAKRGKGASGKDAKGFRLNIVNTIWGQVGYKFRDDYLDILAVNYGAGLRLHDFVNSPEPGRTKINDWVSERTESRIKDLLPAGSVDTLTRLVLTNAIYFNAGWQSPFLKDVTRAGKFNLLNGSQKTVSMMNQASFFGYTEGKDFQAVELPYDGRELGMLILLPRPGQYNTFENSLDEQRYNSITKDLSAQRVALAMPRFEFSSALRLKNTLSELGMAGAFTSNADFSRITGNRDLFIGDAFHKAFISVDEAGTEAAAATAVVMQVTSMPAAPKEVTIDRPFIFIIRDFKTGEVLFIGRVLEI